MSTTLRSASRCAWPAPQPGDSGSRLANSRLTMADGRSRAPWNQAQPYTLGHREPFSSTTPRDTGTALRWALWPDRRDIATSPVWSCTTPVDQSSRHRWGILRPRWTTGGAPWVAKRRSDRGTSIPWGARVAAQWAVRCAWGTARPRDVGSRHPGGLYWRHLDVGWGIPNPPTEWPVYTFSIPAKELYIVPTEIHLTRIDTGAEIPCFGLSARISSDDWVWTLSSAIAGSAAPDFEAAAVEVRATINGYDIRGLVESVRHERRFGSHSATAQARGPAAVLDDPYSARASWGSAVDRTAQQLAADALEFTPWVLDWQITDWLVTAGAWSLYGTPIQVIQTIASAAGAIVQSDRDTDTLHILPAYPIAPWHWATAAPDVEIPLAVCTLVGLSTRTRPDYNRVYVSGASQGVLGQVTRAGTAGDRPAPMVTSPLITHVDAARQRGLAIHSDTGRQALITLHMPISMEVPLLSVGQLASFLEGAVEAWRGLVREVFVSVENQDGRLRVRQQVTIERHY